MLGVSCNGYPRGIVLATCGLPAVGSPFARFLGTCETDVARRGRTVRAGDLEAPTRLDISAALIAIDPKRDRIGN